MTMYQRPFEDVTNKDQAALAKAKELERANKKPLHKFKLKGGAIAYSTRENAAKEWGKYEESNKITFKV